MKRIVRYEHPRRDSWSDRLLYRVGWNTWRMRPAVEGDYLVHRDRWCTPWEELRYRWQRMTGRRYVREMSAAVIRQMSR